MLRQLSSRELDKLHTYLISPSQVTGEVCFKIKTTFLEDYKWSYLNPPFSLDIIFQKQTKTSNLNRQQVQEFYTVLAIG